MYIIFYICGLIAILTTLCVITQINATYALMFFIASLFSISGMFFAVGAYFAGALEIIMYAGAIMVLFIFVIMMLNIGKSKKNHDVMHTINPIIWIFPTIICLIFIIMLTYAILKSNNGQIISSFIIDAKEVGIQLFSKYILIVELSSILLLAGLVVALYIGHKEHK